MKKFGPVLVIFGMVTLFLMSCGLISPSFASGDITITVESKGDVRVTPDMALLNLGVETIAPTAGEAQRENAELMQAVISKLLSLGVDRSQIKTTQFFLWRVSQYREEKEEFKGFQVTHTLEVPVMDLEKVGLILDAAIQAGANTVQDVIFTLRDPQPGYREALSKAVKQARAKAETIAAAENLKIKDVKSIVEKQTWGPWFAAEGEGKEEAITPFVPGSLKIEASVTVTFTLIREKL